MSDELQVRFNRLTGLKVYFFKVFVIGDFFIILLAMMVFANLLRSWISFGVFLIAYMIYLMVFRFNKPMGYDVHKYRRLTKPRRFRPGHVEVLVDTCYEPSKPTKK